MKLQGGVGVSAPLLEEKPQKPRPHPPPRGSSLRWDALARAPPAKVSRPGGLASGRGGAGGRTVGCRAPGMRFISSRQTLLPESRGRKVNTLSGPRGATLGAVRKSSQ